MKTMFILTNCQTWQQIISFITDILTAVSAIAVVVITAIGLYTGKKRLKGTAEYELAKKLLSAVYKVRDTMKDIHFRGTQINPGEIIVLIKRNTSISKGFVENQNHLYGRKLKSLSAALSELDIEALQAEVLWNQDIKDLIESLRKKVNTITGFVYQYIKILNDDEPLA
jgi:NADP-dependent 3-hydroxy acid dehydrogenase YdfG